MAAIAPLDARWLREGARDDAEYESFLARRRAGEPVHRILGWREFWGLRFHLSPETLEPRPDSETLIEVLLKSLPPETRTQSALRVLDLGTGTGCLLLAALHEMPLAVGLGLDQSLGAVATASHNAQINNLQDRATFGQLDWHDTAALLALGQFDVILCNPPYIPSNVMDTLSPEVRNHDPIAALDGGADGLGPYRHLAPLLPALLSPSGMAIFEIGYDQAAAVTAIFMAQGLAVRPPIKDLGGNDRVLVVHLATRA